MFTPCLVFGANPSTEEKSNVTVSCKLRFSFDVIFTEPETFSEDVNSTLYSFAVSESDWEVFESNAKDDEGVERTLKSASDIAKEETTPLIATFFLLSSLPSSSMRVDEDVNDDVFDASHPLFTRLFATHRLPLALFVFSHLRARNGGGCKRNAVDDEHILLCNCYRVSRRLFALNVRSERGVKVGEIEQSKSG